MSTADITRDLVVDAAHGLRAGDPSTTQGAALDTALRTIVARVAGVGTDDIASVVAYPAAAGDDADGLLVDARLRTAEPDATRSCTFAAFAATDAAFTLTGSLVLKGAPVDSTAAPAALHTVPLAGPVVATEPVDTASYGVLTLDAVGATTGIATGSEVQTIPDPKSAAQKRTARRTYDRQVSAARKAYAKALKKAGSSKRRKKAAKVAWTRRKAAAKAAYDAAVVEVRQVTVPRTGAESRPFALRISTDFVV